jgi:hypothetical protein
MPHRFFTSLFRKRALKPQPRALQCLLAEEQGHGRISTGKSIRQPLFNK